MESNKKYVIGLDFGTDSCRALVVDTEVISDEMIDVALDRAMLDDYSLYVYLSDASVE